MAAGSTQTLSTPTTYSGMLSFYLATAASTGIANIRIVFPGTNLEFLQVGPGVFVDRSLSLPGEAQVTIQNSDATNTLPLATTGWFYY
jgi:hypothetical protein